MKMRVADYITKFLIKKNIKVTFFLSGGGMMHLIDAVGKQEGMDYICGHHEQACCTASDVYARISGNVGVCYLTSGPGVTNSVTSIAEAWIDSSPVIL